MPDHDDHDAPQDPTDGPDTTPDISGTGTPDRRPGPAETNATLDWPHLLDAIRTVGVTDGADAAEWWIQDTIGGRTTGDPGPAARRILDGITDGDPAVLDTLPGTNSGWAASFAARHRGTSSGDHAAAAAGLTGEQWQQAETAYHDGFDTALTDAIAAACRRTLSPTGDDRDLTGLHPDRLTLGGVGVFAGDWGCHTDGDGAWRIRRGYVGTLIDTWNGFAVFRCTRAVADAIVADLQHNRDTYRRHVAATGVAADLDRHVDESLARVRFDGDVIIVDSTRVSGDPDDVERIGPDDDGRYVVMGWSWCWEAVDPYDCDRIAGDLPEPDRQQEWVLLTHAPYTRVAPDPYRVTAVRHRPNGTFVAELHYNGDLIAAVLGGLWPTHLAATSVPFDAAQWQAYVAAARHCGKPMTEAALLDTLADEYRLSVATGAETAAGNTLVRLLDDTGSTLAVVRVTPRPDSPAAFRDVREHLRHQPAHPYGAGWQYWTGTAWRHLLPAGTQPAGSGQEPTPAPGHGTHRDGNTERSAT
ncbi:hypothetical protein AB0M46_44885 [Dactylosporangium sp. NPDC051485]|uniref:hypothetical protein n=1 Tax=Dactylosporangium sp. NPDC051485 TaxID=3154846 RepID=UPI00341CCF71